MKCRKLYTINNTADYERGITDGWRAGLRHPIGDPGVEFIRGDYNIGFYLGAKLAQQKLDHLESMR